MSATLEELVASAEAATQPRIVDKCKVSIGGVDPLGLRQINFDMMDQVLPGLNNVARHIQPYLLMCWAWRRCNQLVERKGMATVGEMRDFVDRIETIYAWSQFLVEPATDLPGRQALAPLIGVDSYVFAGTSWEKFRDTRRYSTGLIAAVNYGPGLRTMRWISDLSGMSASGVVQAGAYKANPEEDAALEQAIVAFEDHLDGELDHPVFNEFGKVTAQLDEVRRWGELWQMDVLDEAEKNAAWGRLISGDGREVRSKGLELVRFCATYRTNEVREPNEVRRLMANPDGVDFPDHLLPYARRWRRMQVRQVFRLALEGLLHWTQGQLEVRPLPTLRLASRLIELVGDDANHRDASLWLGQFGGSDDPVEHLDHLAECLVGGERFEDALLRALVFCMAEAPDQAEPFERSDRLPLLKAAREWKEWAQLKPVEFVARLLEGWVFAQHTYWSVGRGLQDARGNGKMILRLRLFIDEGGWRIPDGIGQGSPPNATPDRIDTAISLLRECGQL